MYWLYLFIYTSVESYRSHSIFGMFKLQVCLTFITQMHRVVTEVCCYY